MHETINEPVDVLASFEYGVKRVMKVRPQVIKWRGRRYKVETFGLYHPERRGTRLFHIFSFSCGAVAFRVELDPDTLGWTLTEAFYG